jgi:peptidase YpeB-like protein
MRKIFIGGCAALMLMTGAIGAASAGPLSAPNSVEAGTIIRINDNGYYGTDYGRGSYGNHYYGNAGYGYSQSVVSPWSIVRSLRHQGFSYISQPALAGQFYQVKARDPNGHKVKVYIDAYSGRIAKVKG